MAIVGYDKAIFQTICNAFLKRNGISIHHVYKLLNTMFMIDTSNHTFHVVSILNGK